MTVLTQPTRSKSGYVTQLGMSTCTVTKTQVPMSGSAIGAMTAVEGTDLDAMAEHR